MTLLMDWSSVWKVIAQLLIKQSTSWTVSHACVLEMTLGLVITGGKVPCWSPGCLEIAPTPFKGTKSLSSSEPECNRQIGSWKLKMHKSLKLATLVIVLAEIALNSNRAVVPTAAKGKVHPIVPSSTHFQIVIFYPRIQWSLAQLIIQFV